MPGRPQRGDQCVEVAERGQWLQGRAHRSRAAGRGGAAARSGGAAGAFDGVERLPRRRLVVGHQPPLDTCVQHDAEAVRHHVVELPRDPGPLGGGRRDGLALGVRGAGSGASASRLRWCNTRPRTTAVPQNTNVGEEVGSGRPADTAANSAASGSPAAARPSGSASRSACRPSEKKATSTHRGRARARAGARGRGAAGAGSRSRGPRRRRSSGPGVQRAIRGSGLRRRAPAPSTRPAPGRFPGSARRRRPGSARRARPAAPTSAPGSHARQRSNTGRPPPPLPGPFGSTSRRRPPRVTRVRWLRTTARGGGGEPSERRRWWLHDPRRTP